MARRTREIEDYEVIQKKMSDHPPCHICSAPAVFFMEKDGFEEYLCPSCGLSFVFPQPKAEWLKEKVYSYESGYQANKSADLSLLPEEKRTARIFDFLSKKRSKGNLLDVGCSSGGFMFSARKRGFSCRGVEINKRTADIAVANGFMVHNGFLESAPFEKKSFDIVYLGDVIEHVNDPRSVVKTCVDFLKDDGLLVISTPNVDCFWSRATLLFYRSFKIPWSSATPPHHLFQFSFDNLGMLLKEQDFSSIYSIFAKPPSLKYEFGSLHLFKKYKEKKTLGNILYMLFAFGIYSCVYALNIALRPFLTKDFRMVVFYER